MAGSDQVTAPTTMAARVEDYLEVRRALGYQLRIEGQELQRFARFADREGHQGPVTIALALRWAMLPRDADRLYWARRLDFVRRFARYRVPFDGGTEVPPPGLLGPSYRRPEPHIYTDDEIATLLRAAATLPTRWKLRPQTYLTLLGLLLTTGLRISEALRLERADVDLDTGVLTVRASKFHGARLVPVHVSVVAALRRYAALRDARHPHPRSTTFFLSEHATSLKYNKVRATFAALRRHLPQPPPGTGRWPPRIHDIRHSFAVARLRRWYEEGCEIGNKIVVLSTYLGHVKVTDTYWYLTACPLLLAVTAERFERYVQAPEVVS